MAGTVEKSITQAVTKSLKQMLSEDNAYMVSILKKMKSTNYVQPGEVPNIDLYMDQVTKFMDLPRAASYQVC